MDQTSRNADRLQSLDWLRGLVMVLMVIDHVRVFSGIPAGGPTADLFLTRWITHFCAPAFVFLAGSSAWLYARRHADVARFLLTRGLVLIALEFTLVRLGWTFNLRYDEYALAGVIWVIGASLLALALLSRLPERAVLVIGLAIVCGHNLADGLLGDGLQALAQSPWSPLWKFLYLGFHAGPIEIGALQLHVLYALVPWIGVIALGFAFAPVLQWEPARRDRCCIVLGLSAILLFVLLRATNVYGNPWPWVPESGWMGFLGTNKYPASLQFLLMTLGPMLLAMPYAARAQGFVAHWLVVIGREPLCFYLLHLPLLHLLAIAASWARTGAVDPWLFANHPMGAGPAPEAHVWPLWLLYAVVVIAVPLLALACRGYAHWKSAGAPRWTRWI